jgi:predicted dehydrogenase
MTLKVALLGTNGHTGLVLDGLNEIEDCQLVGVCPTYPGESLDNFKRKKAFSEKTRFFETPLEVLESTKPDLVGVCMPFVENASVSRMALERGISVISEKPLATHLEDLDLLKKTAEHSSGRITAMYAMRFAEDFHAAQVAVESGAIGKVALGFAQKSYQWGDRGDFYKDRDSYGGTVPWVGVHAIDSLRWAIGREFISVRGLHDNLVRTDYPGCEDCAGLVFELEGGGQAVITLDYLRPEEAASHGDDRIRLAGSKGVVEVRRQDNFSEIVTDTEGAKPLEIGAPIPFVVDFVREMREGIPHRISQEDAFRVTEIALIAREACDRKEAMPLV